MSIIIYSIVYISSAIVFMLVCGLIFKYEIPSKVVFSLVAVGIILRIVLIPIQPVGSDDWYRYIWDGKVMDEGINPYRYAPANPALAQLRSTILPSRINHADMKTIYPPLAEILFYAAYKIDGESFLGLKLLLFIFDLATILGIFLITNKLVLNLKNILIYALCPLLLFQFFVDGHADGFGIALLVFSIFFYLDDKKVMSYLFIGLSASIKPISLILVPVLFFHEKSFREKIKVVIMSLAILALFYLPFIFSGTPFKALATFSENWTFNGIVFDLLNVFIKDNQRTRMICGILFVIFYLRTIMSHHKTINTVESLLQKIYVSIFLLYIFSPVVHPWYLSWLAILLPLVPRWSGIVYVSLISLTAFTVINYRSTGVWKEYLFVLLLEYVPVLALFVYELVRNDRSSEKTAVLQQ
ncbi:MAG TPA: hypothetical protein VEF33_00165 [Syntrophales bacterium]|nr:hypothetical protein [Syntrophales bacterium]